MAWFWGQGGEAIIGEQKAQDLGGKAHTNSCYMMFKKLRIR